MKNIISAVLLSFVCMTAHAITTLKILFAFTRTAAAGFAPIGLGTAVSGEIGLFNNALTNSKINSSVAVAAAGYITIGSEYSIDQAGVDQATQDLYIAINRDASGADVVVVVGGYPPALPPPWPTGSTRCGWAQDIKPAPEKAFAVVAWTCFANNMAARHEVGHLLGLRHQATGGIFPDSTLTPYANGHGFQMDFKSPTVGDSYCFYDLMANPMSSCASAPNYVPSRQNYYSAVAVTAHDTNGQGAVNGGSADWPYYADAATVLLASLPVVANNHLTKTSPPMISRIVAIIWAAITQ